MAPRSTPSSLVPSSKAFLITASIVVSIGAISLRASAGEYHVGESLVCGDCHKNGERLKRSDVNATCLSCHGGAKDAPDVVGSSRSGVVRQAGALNGMGGSGHAGTGHTLGSGSPAPGGTWTPGPRGLTCIDCHAPHGVLDQYRNLLLRPGTADTDRLITYTVSRANDRSRDVWVLDSPLMPERYAAPNVRFNQPIPGRSAYAEWCQGCHTDFIGEEDAPRSMGSLRADAGRGWRRHPTVGITVGADGDRHSSFERYSSLQNRVPTLSASGRWPSRDNVVACMSCHKAHGNENPFGLLYMSGRGHLSEEGDTGGTQHTDLCGQCHVQRP